MMQQICQERTAKTHLLQQVLPGYQEKEKPYKADVVALTEN